MLTFRTKQKQSQSGLALSCCCTIRGLRRRPFFSQRDGLSNLVLHGQRGARGQWRDLSDLHGDLSTPELAVLCCSSVAFLRVELLRRLKYSAFSSAPGAGVGAQGGRVLRRCLSSRRTQPVLNTRANQK